MGGRKTRPGRRHRPDQAMSATLTWSQRRRIRREGARQAIVSSDSHGVSARVGQCHEKQRRNGDPQVWSGKGSKKLLSFLILVLFLCFFLQFLLQIFFFFFFLFLQIFLFLPFPILLLDLVLVLLLLFLLNDRW